MEPWGLLFTAIADVGDNMKLMGTEWATDRFQSIALAVASAPLSATYLKGVGDLFDFFSGESGAQGRIIGNIMNAQVPLSGLRNDIGKILNPGLREINNSIIESIRNRNKITEHIAAKPLPIKYSPLNGQPLKRLSPLSQFFNDVSGVSIYPANTPGNQLLINSNYDLRLSFYAYKGISLADHPDIRSEFMKQTGLYRFGSGRNLEEELEHLAGRADVKASLELMYKHRRQGKTYLNPMQTYAHNALIKQRFEEAKKKAWAIISKLPEVQVLIDEKNSIRGEQFKIKQKTNQFKYQQVDSVLNMVK